MTENTLDTITSLETKVEATLDLLEAAPNKDVKKVWGKNYKSLMDDLKKLGSLSGGTDRLKKWPSVAIIDVLKVARKDPNHKLPTNFDLKAFIQERRRKEGKLPGVPEVSGSSGGKRTEELKKKAEAKPVGSKEKKAPKTRDELVRDRARANEAELNARLREVEQRMRVDSEYETGEGTGKESQGQKGKRKRRVSDSPHKEDKADEKRVEKPDRGLKKKQRTDDEEDESESKGKLVTYTSKHRRGKGEREEEEVEDAAERGTGSDEGSGSEEESEEDDGSEEDVDEAGCGDVMDVEDVGTKKKESSKKGKEKATDMMDVDDPNQKALATPMVPVDAHVPPAPRSTKNGAAWTQKATSNKIFATLHRNNPPCDRCLEKKDDCYKQWFSITARTAADRGGKALGRACYYCAGSHQKCSLNADVGKAGSTVEGSSRISAPPPEPSKTTKRAVTAHVPKKESHRTIRPPTGDVPAGDSTTARLEQAMEMITNLVARVQSLEDKLAARDSASHAPPAPVMEEEGGRSFRASTRSARAARAAEDDTALRDMVESLRQTSDANLHAIAESYEGVRISIADLRKHVERVNRQTQQLYNSQRAHMTMPGWTALSPNRYAGPEFCGVPLPLVLHLASGAKLDLTTTPPTIAYAEHVVMSSDGTGYSVAEPWDITKLFMPCNPNEWVQAPIVRVLQQQPSGTQIMTAPYIQQAPSGLSTGSGPLYLDPPNDLPSPTMLGASSTSTPQGDTGMVPPAAFAPSISRPPMRPTTVSTKVVPATSVRRDMAAPPEVTSQAEDSTPAEDGSVGGEAVPTRKGKNRATKRAAKKKAGT